jgi:hypothetical protein
LATCRIRRVATVADFGAPLPLTDAALDQAAEIDEADVAQAQSFWRNALKGSLFAALVLLLDAQRVNALPAIGVAPTTPFRWNAGTRTYQTAGGTLVPDSRVRSALDVAIDVQAARLRSFTTLLQDGQLSLSEWQAMAMQAVKVTHLAAASAAKGGWAEMDAAARQWVSERVRVQHDYLRLFAQQVVDGRQPFNAAMLRRVAMYAEAARQTHREMQRQEARQAGATEERNVLGVADHCGGDAIEAGKEAPLDTCIGQTRLGWVPIGTLLPTGSRQCLTNCRCVILTRTTAEALAA